MMFTDRALEAGHITQQEADLIENWIDEHCVKDNAIVPDELSELWSKIALFNWGGTMQ